MTVTVDRVTCHQIEQQMRPSLGLAHWFGQSILQPLTPPLRAKHFSTNDNLIPRSPPPHNYTQALSAFPYFVSWQSKGPAFVVFLCYPLEYHILYYIWDSLLLRRPNAINLMYITSISWRLFIYIYIQTMTCGSACLFFQQSSLLCKSVTELRS